MAVAGLASAHDRNWTADRSPAAQRQSELQPDLAPSSVAALLGHGTAPPSPENVLHAFADEGIVSALLKRFGHLTGP